MSDTTSSSERPQPHAIAKALKWVRRYVLTESWPEDHWISIDDSWDLNLWLDDNNNLRATMYKVEKGDTQTNKGWGIFNFENDAEEE